MPTAVNAAPNTVRCTRCGTDFPSGTVDCPSCGRAASPRSVRVTVSITLLLIFMGVAFTQYFVNLHRATQYSLAHRWFVRGGEAMQAQLSSVAADDYRTALSYDPENREYRLRLAQALLADNRLNESRAHLTSLWLQEPANGEVNLTLARLYAKQGDTANAVRYYNNAINSVWNEDPRQKRTAVRFELANYLMQQRKWTQAQSELMALLAEEPQDPASQLRLGEMLLQVNEPEHTVQLDNSVLARDRTNSAAFLQKGQALLVLGKYREAEHALANAVAQNPKLDEARWQLALVRELLRADTSLRGLSRRERAERAIDAFHTAWKRLSACAKQQDVALANPATPSNPPAGTATTFAKLPAALVNELQLLYTGGLQKQAILSEEALRDDPDLVDSTMQYVFDVERTTAQACPGMSITDQALLILAQHENEALK